MSNSKMTKRALLASIVSLVLCFVMLTGTTFAWFTDQEISANNKIIAGNLDVQLLMYDVDEGDYVDIGASGDPIFAGGDYAQNQNNATLWEPGKTQIAYLAIKNAGNLAFVYNVLVDVEDLGLVGVLEYAIIDGAQASDNLSQYSWAEVKNAAGNNYGFIAEGRTVAAENGCLDEIANGMVDETDFFALAIHMSEGADNNYKGKSAIIDIIVNATQVAAEADSFDNQYDVDSPWIGAANTAWYDANATEFTLDNASDLAGLAMLVNTGVDNFAGKTFVLSADVDLSNIKWIPIGNGAHPFAGKFDGGNNTVSNLFIDGADGHAGLFGYVAVGTNISNLTVENVVIVDTATGADEDGASCIGAVVGYCPGAMTVENVNVIGNIQISGDWYTSALVGRSKGSTITNCSVIGGDASYIESGRWAAGVSGYDNGAMNVSGCVVENLEIKTASYGAGLVGLAASGTKLYGNSVNNVEVILEGAEAENTLTYGAGVGGVAVYSYSTAPTTAYDNSYTGVTFTVNGVASQAQDMGSKYADGTDQGLIMMPTVKLGNNYYTYLKKAFEAVAKDGSEVVVELTGDAYITAKFKPQVAKNQNIVLKTNGYNLIWVEQDANKMPVTNADGSLVTTVVTATNMSSYITVKTGGAIVIE